MSRLLIHIGYHKTGTSWLQRKVFPSRKLGFAEPIPPGWLKGRIVAPHDLEFDADRVRMRILKRLDRPLAEGRVPVLSAARFCGDLDLRLHDSVQVADRLATMFQGERVLMVVREQRAMILSSYKQYVKTGGLLSLDRYLAGGDWWWHYPFQPSQYAFDRLIAHYHSRFGEENVLVLPYELLRRDGREFVSRIMDFAGARAVPDALATLPLESFVNAGAPVTSVAVRRRLNRYMRHPSTPWAAFRVGSRRGRLMLSASHRAGRLTPAALNRRLEQRMRDAVSRAVGDTYRESNARTSELTGIDLAEYGYDVAGPGTDAPRSTSDRERGSAVAGR